MSRGSCLVVLHTSLFDRVTRAVHGMAQPYPKIGLPDGLGHQNERMKGLIQDWRKDQERRCRIDARASRSL
jgi:hypothetical protein